MIIDVQADGWNASAGLSHHCPVPADIDERGEDSAVGVTAIRVDDEFVSPGRFEFDAVVEQRDDLQAEPLVVRGAGDQLPHALDRDFIARHGVTTTLPITSRS